MNKKFYKVPSLLITIFLICCQVAASAALEEYKNTPVYSYQVSGDSNPPKAAGLTASGAQNVVEDKSVVGISPAASAAVDDEEPENSLDVPFAASAPTTEPVSSSSSSSSSSAAASVDVGKLHRCMTIEEWANASMNDVLADMGVFTKDQMTAITDAEKRLLNKLYCGGQYNGPHVAVARLLFLTARNNFLALNLPCAFISGANSPKSDPKNDKSQLNFSGSELVTIAPFISSSAQSFAHSERAVGVYLLEQCVGKGGKIKGEINEIVCKYGCTCIIIQIKCALPPCENCIKFWNGMSCVSKRTCSGTGEPEVKRFCSETFKGAEGAEKTDWLGKIRTSLCTDVPIGVNISCCGSVTSRCVFVKSLFERLLKSGDGENEDERGS